MNGLPETGQYIVMIGGTVLVIVGLLIGVFLIFVRKNKDKEDL